MLCPLEPGIYLLRIWLLDLAIKRLSAFSKSAAAILLEAGDHSGLAFYQHQYVAEVC